jgi:hypothetical protein
VISASRPGDARLPVWSATDPEILAQLKRSYRRRETVRDRGWPPIRWYGWRCCKSSMTKTRRGNSSRGDIWNCP